MPYFDKISWLTDKIYSTPFRSIIISLMFFSTAYGINFQLPLIFLSIYLITYLTLEDISFALKNKTFLSSIFIQLLAGLILLGIIFNNQSPKIHDPELKILIWITIITSLNLIFFTENRFRNSTQVIKNFILPVIVGKSLFLLSTFTYFLNHNEIPKTATLINIFDWSQRNLALPFFYHQTALLSGFFFLLYVHLKETKLHQLIKSEESKLLSLIILYFLLGLGVTHGLNYFIPSLLLIFYLFNFFKPGNLKKLCSSRIMLYFYITTVAYFTSVYLIGGNSIPRIDHNESMVISILYSSVFLLTAINESWKTLSKITISFCLGTALYAGIILIYSAWLDPVEHGYKYLFNPIANEYINSPIRSNYMLVAFCSSAIGLLFSKKNSHILFFSIIMVFSTQSLLFIMGRTFVLLSSLFLFFLILFYKNKLNLIPLLFSVIASCLLLLINYSFILSEPMIDRFDQMMINRLPDILNPNNPRYILWLEGISYIFNNPSGGIEPVLYDTQSKSYHHIWLDTWKHSGWFSLALLFIMNTLSFVGFYKNLFKKNKFAFILLGIVLLALISQDVVLESKLIYAFYGYIMISIFLLSKVKMPLESTRDNKKNNLIK